MKKILIFAFLLITNFAFSQSNFVKAKTIPMISLNYSLQFPQHDMAERFGINSMIGSSFYLKLESNFIFGIEANYLFGNQIEEDEIFDLLKTSNGEIINLYGEYADYILSERGYFLGAKIGYLFPVLSPNENSGILFYTNFGFLEHKIRIDNNGNNTPQIINDYAKGYDRLTNGFALNEFIGYSFLSDNGKINFYVGFETYQAWTKNRRDFNFDTKQKDNTDRKDFLYGIRFGWIIPIQKQKADNYYIR